MMSGISESGRTLHGPLLSWLRPARRCLVGLGLVMSGLLVAVGGAAASGRRMDETLYPPPVAPKHAIALPFPTGSHFACPSPRGLQARSRGSTTGALRALLSLDRAVGSRNLRRAEMYADRAGWPWLTFMLKDGMRTPSTRASRLASRYVLIQSPDKASPYLAALYRKACGNALIAASVAAISCAPGGQALPPRICLRRYPDQTAYDFLLRRHGHWLFWAFQGGA